MKKIRGTLEPWNPLSLFNKGKQEPEADKKGVEKSKSADLGNILEKHKVVAKKILSKSPTNEGFYSVNPVTVQNDFQGVWTPLDFDIDALYAIPKKRNKCVRYLFYIICIYPGRNFDVSLIKFYSIEQKLIPWC